LAKSVVIIGTRGYPSYYGGFETAVRKLAPYLADRGWDVIVYGRRDSTRLDDPTRDPRVISFVTPGLETKSVSTLSYGLTATVHALLKKPDVALVMNVANGFFLPLLNSRRIPSLVNVDGIEWDRAKWGRVAKAVFHSGARWTARFGTRLVYDSREIEKRWRREFDVGGDFIPYGGDLPRELPLVGDLEHRRYVLIVARFVPENTVPEFFEAVSVLARNYKIVIVGSSGYGGPLDQAARQLATNHENVSWLGHVSDDEQLLSLWQHAGAYFHGHSVGGTNPALVQAMAAGSPVVARDTPYNREVLGQDGKFCKPDAGSIIAAIEDVMSNPAISEALSRSGVQRAAASYTWDLVCESYRLSLEALIASKSEPVR
jgi:glycosyltransferase involved in cell wall biosynthesis